MVLKIRDEQGGFFVFDLVRFHHWPIQEKEYQETLNKNDGIPPWNLVIRRNISTARKDDDQIMSYILKLQDGSSFHIVTDTEGYLCGADGKTIEKIVA